MSFGGIGSILSGVAGMAVTPAMETYIQEMLRKGITGIKDTDLDPDTLDTIGNIAGGTLGTVLGTGLNAGLGYLTGGKEGAAAGAAQGLIMSGGAALQHDKFLDSMGMGNKTAAKPAGTQQSAANTQQATSNNPSILELATGKKQDVYPSSKIGEDTLGAAKPETSAGGSDDDSTGEKKPGYFELTGELGMPAWTIGMGLGSSMAYANKNKQLEDERKYKEALQQQKLNSLMSYLYSGRGYAGGGELTVSANAGVPTTVTFPEWFIDEFAGTGGLGGYAAGGYINTGEFNPDSAYPQSMIHRAEPYPAAAPIRNQVVNMERGGLLEGEGDGMSDHIPANIDGKEEVRVADGEYVVPKNVAARIGEDKLQQMLTKVRAAAHAKKGKQIIENAGKKAFIQTMSGVKA